MSSTPEQDRKCENRWRLVELTGNTKSLSDGTLIAGPTESLSIVLAWCCVLAKPEPVGHIQSNGDVAERLKAAVC